MQKPPVSKPNTEILCDNHFLNLVTLAFTGPLQPRRRRSRRPDILRRRFGQQPPRPTGRAQGISPKIRSSIENLFEEKFGKSSKSLALFPDCRVLRSAERFLDGLAGYVLPPSRARRHLHGEQVVRLWR